MGERLGLSGQVPSVLRPGLGVVIVVDEVAGDVVIGESAPG